jgi:hypothetical protein
MHDPALQSNYRTSCEIEAFKADVAAINQAFGAPICEGVAVEGDSVTMTMTPAQAKFLTNYLTTTVSLMGMGLKVRLEDHASNVRANQVIDTMVAQYSGDDYPATIRDMLAKGMVDEMQGIVADAMIKAASANLPKFCAAAAELALDRARMDFQTTPVISLFHDVVEIGIGTHQERAEAELEAAKQSLDIESGGENIIHYDFSKPKATVTPIRPAVQGNVAK